LFTHKSVPVIFEPPCNIHNVVHKKFVSVKSAIVLNILLHFLQSSHICGQ